MSKISGPIKFSTYWKVPQAKLETLGVIDPLLNVDTALSVDPLLLQSSAHPEFSQSGHSRFYNYFASMLPLLVAATTSTRARAAALNLMLIPEKKEIRGTCLGYGAGTIHGHAIGPKKANQMLDAAIEIAGLGVKDPNLFMVIPLLEDGIGPDLISDITISILLEDFANFNNRIISELGLIDQTKSFRINRNNINLLENPLEANTPILLTPKDILRDLPIATDWEDVCKIAADNSQYRDSISKYIGEIWKKKITKERRKETALSSKESFESLLEIVMDAGIKPYDFKNDPKGEMGWHDWLDKAWDVLPKKIEKPKLNNIKSLFDIVKQIIDHFRELIEDNQLNRELWHNGKAKPEKTAQRLFFAVADCYCRHNDIDITPEADSGSGPVDFKFSKGYRNRVLVEIKLSTNRLRHGYEMQLEAYKDAEHTTKAFYLVIDVGGEIDKKINDILAIKNNLASEKKPSSELEIIDGRIKKSASKR